MLGRTPSKSGWTWWRSRHVGHVGEGATGHRQHIMFPYWSLEPPRGLPTPTFYIPVYFLSFLALGVMATLPYFPLTGENGYLIMRTNL